MSDGKLGESPDTAAWYSEAIGKVRVASTPGGDAFTVEQAEAFRDELDEAIERAREDQ